MMDVPKLKTEMSLELLSILGYWTNHTLDHMHGGFYGKINHSGEVVSEASKGIILNTRILWSFSAASNHLQTENYRQVCDRAYGYLRDYFKDSEFLGVYWELDYLGNPINKRKQVYAQAFAIYALTEYYLFSKNEDAKKWAIEIFETIEQFANDGDGYIEAFGEDWSDLDDVRLSEKDMNAPKTMNTHLHILEAYTSLLRVYHAPVLKNALTSLVHMFLEKFIDDQNHYGLFFSTNWELQSHIVSYGHDIECAWLLIEAAKVLEDDLLLKKCNEWALRVADTFLNEGLDKEGAVMNEKNTQTGVVDTDRHWWPQVEAIIGLYYAYQLSGNEKYIQAAFGIWDFTKNHLIDKVNGEWFFRVDKDGKVYTEEDKVSMWKAPYHTSRACINLSS